jgi:hypothetical protein
MFKTRGGGEELVTLLCLDFNVGFLLAFENHSPKQGLVLTDVWREYNWIKGFPETSLIWSKLAHSSTSVPSNIS